MSFQQEKPRKDVVLILINLRRTLVWKLNARANDMFSYDCGEGFYKKGTLSETDAQTCNGCTEQSYSVRLSLNVIAL